MLSDGVDAGFCSSWQPQWRHRRHDSASLGGLGTCPLLAFVSPPALR